MSESKELTLPERAAVALGAPKYEQEIRELLARSATITEVKNKDGRDQCHGALMTLKGARVAIEKTAKAAREDATAFSKAVIAEEKRLVAIAEPEEARLTGLRDKWDAEREAEKQAKLAAEKARVDGIRARIDEIRNLPASMVGKSSDEIGVAADHLSEYVIGLDEWQEFAGEAQVERNHVVKRLREMQEAQRTHETEQARIAAEREALERQRAALAEQERLAAVERAQREAMDRAERERIAAEQQAAQEKAAAALRAQQEAHAELVREQQAELAKQQAAIDAERERQAAEAARVEREKQEAIAAEAARVAAEAQAKHDAEEAEAARIAQAEADRIFAEHEVQRVAAESAEAERQNTAEIHDLFQPQIVEMVTIPKSEYELLLARVEWLDCLEAAGVDNWSGFDDAREIMREQAA
jgi:hypothetical protein